MSDPSASPDQAEPAPTAHEVMSDVVHAVIVCCSILSRTCGGEKFKKKDAATDLNEMAASLKDKWDRLNAADTSPAERDPTF